MDESTIWLYRGARAAAAHSASTPYSDVLPSDLCRAACEAMGIDTIRDLYTYAVIMAACAAASQQGGEGIPRSFDIEAAVRGMAAGFALAEGFDGE